VTYYAYHKTQTQLQNTSNMKRENQIFGMMDTHIHIDAKTDQDNIGYFLISN